MESQALLKGSRIYLFLLADFLIEPGSSRVREVTQLGWGCAAVTVKFVITKILE